MTDKELLQQALDALNEFDSGKRNHGMTWQVPLIKTIKARLAQSENEFNPDWNRVEALEESLREHMAEIQRLRALLAQPDSDPIAEVGIWDNGQLHITFLPASDYLQHGDKLYTAPPKKEWVGLTDEKISEIWSIIEMQNDVMHEIKKFARAIEAKLKEKNT